MVLEANFKWLLGVLDGCWSIRVVIVKMQNIRITFEFTLTGTYMYRDRVNQHLIVLKLDCALINEILVMKFVTVPVSQNLNLM